MNFKKNPDIVDRIIRGERVLVPVMRSLDEMTGIYNLNETASVIYEEACGGKNTDEIASVLVQRFEVSSDEAVEDTRRTLRELEDIGALIADT